MRYKNNILTLIICILIFSCEYDFSDLESVKKPFIEIPDSVYNKVVMYNINNSGTLVNYDVSAVSIEKKSFYTDYVIYLKNNPKRLRISIVNTDSLALNKTYRVVPQASLLVQGTAYIIYADSYTAQYSNDNITIDNQYYDNKFVLRLDNLPVVTSNIKAFISGKILINR